MRTRGIALALALGSIATAVACGEEEGPAERAGREMDEATQEAVGSLEELGREVGEAADESKEAAEKLRDTGEE